MAVVFDHTPQLFCNVNVGLRWESASFVVISPVKSTKINLAGIGMKLSDQNKRFGVLFKMNEK